MLQKTGVVLQFWAFYVESKVGKTGLTVTADVWEKVSGSAAAEIISGASATEVGDGYYVYELASASVDANGSYMAVFKTATTTVDAQHLPSAWFTPVWLTTLGTATVTFTNPVTDDGSVTLVRGDDYSNTDSRALNWTVTGFPVLTGATVNFSIRPEGGGTVALTKAGSVVAVDQVRVELTAAETDDLKPTGGEPYIFDVQAILPVNLRRLTLVRGSCTVYEDATT